ncbi:hypothetical protein HYR99_37230 [Candidatus Poribacteria bacterium]|nr:hypothetical protein [Candidatus Poribacteria bacterium]
MKPIIRRIGLTLILLSFVLVFLTSCAKIPGAAPELSTELGNRISAIEAAHITLLQRFFDEKRDQVDLFLMEKWVPTFTEEFFNNPEIAKIWDGVVASDNPQARLQLFVKLGPKLQTEINAKRLELVKPLDGLEETIERRLREEYQQARAINNSITSFLASASQVDENRRRYLEAIGITDQKVAQAIDQVDSAVSGLRGKAETAEDAVNLTEAFTKNIKRTIESLNAPVERKEISK